MNSLEGVMAGAAEMQAFCLRQGWRFCFIGGIAVQRWGAPRFTQDADLTLLTGFDLEEKFIDAVLQHFPGRLSDTKRFALQHRVILARTAAGVPLDISLGAFPFEEGTTDRATLWHVSDTISLTTCSAEDLIIHKVFAARDRDWSDVESVLTRQHGRLNLGHVRTELPALLELTDDTVSLAKLETMIVTVAKRLEP